MPRGQINVARELEYLSVLDEDGKLDEEHAPEISDDDLKAMHRAMLLARRFDERMLNLQRQGRIGTFGPVKGQEAAQIGTIAAIGDDDWLIPSYRETAAALWRGTPMSGLLVYNAGFNEGGRIPDEQNDTPIAIPVGTQMLHAVGIAYGLKYKGQDKVTMTYFGDGATSQGDFHEAMNFAAVFETPTVFVCQNNQYAISLPRSKQTQSATLAQKALAYGVPGIQVDGNDLLAVYAAATEAVKRAREEHRPTLIECVTYRMEVHTTADDPTRYREDEEVERWAKRDPIERIQRYLKDRGALDDEAIEELESEIKDEIESAWSEAQEAIETYGEDPLHMFEHLFAEKPPYLEEQREALSRALKAGAGKGAGQPQADGDEDDDEEADEEAGEDDGDG